MCLSAEALVLFLNILAFERIESEPGKFTILADEQQAHWVSVEDQWCTTAPQLDRDRRFAHAAKGQPV